MRFCNKLFPSNDRIADYRKLWNGLKNYFRWRLIDLYNTTLHLAHELKWLALGEKTTKWIDHIKIEIEEENLKQITEGKINLDQNKDKVTWRIYD